MLKNYNNNHKWGSFTGLITTCEHIINHILGKLFYQTLQFQFSFLFSFGCLQWDVNKLCFEYDTDPYYQALDMKVKVRACIFLL